MDVRPASSSKCLPCDFYKSLLYSLECSNPIRKLFRVYHASGSFKRYFLPDQSEKTAATMQVVEMQKKSRGVVKKLKNLG